MQSWYNLKSFLEIDIKYIITTFELIDDDDNIFIRFYYKGSQSTYLLEKLELFELYNKS